MSDELVRIWKEPAMAHFKTCLMYRNFMERLRTITKAKPVTKLSFEPIQTHNIAVKLARLVQRKENGKKHTGGRKDDAD
jgi:hypothetical protein